MFPHLVNFTLKYKLKSVKGEFYESEHCWTFERVIFETRCCCTMLQSMFFVKFKFFNKQESLN